MEDKPAAYIGGTIGGHIIRTETQSPIIHLTIGPATLRIERKMSQRQMSMLADFVKDIRYSDVCIQEEPPKPPSPFSIDPTLTPVQEPVDLEHPTIDIEAVEKDTLRAHELGNF